MLTQPPSPPQKDYPRYSAKDFPPYRFIPGLNPHPTENPQGHSYKKEIFPNKVVTPTQSSVIDPIFLYGVDLYNYAYWWEAHEAWESMWQRTKDPLQRQFLQGLIKVSGAFLKWYMEQPRGVSILYSTAIQHLGFVVEKEKVFFGLNLSEYLLKLNQHFSWINDHPKIFPDPLKEYPFIQLNDKFLEGH